MQEVRFQRVLSLCRKLAAQKAMLNRGEAPSAQLFAISEEAEIRYNQRRPALRGARGGAQQRRGELERDERAVI